MEFLITGGTGFIGSWLIKRLLASGYRLRVLRRKKSDLTEIKDLPLDHFIGDITDLESVKKAARGVHSVFHLAGKIAFSKSERDSMKRINVEGTRNVIQAVLSEKVQKLVHVSSVVAVGAGFNEHQILNEDSTYNMSAFNLGYFETKKEAEDLVLEAVKRESLQAVILNPSVVYGPGDVRKSSRKIPLKVAQGKFPFYSPGGFSLVYVEDVVEGIYRAWEKGRIGERYILGGENLKIKRIFELIAKEAQTSPPRFPIPQALLFLLGKCGDFFENFGLRFFLDSEQAKVSSLFHWFDSLKAKKELEFQPKPAKFAISKSVKWMRDQGLL